VLQRGAHAAVAHEGAHVLIVQVAELVHAQLVRDLRARGSGPCPVT
jgi:hypothetical protein